MKNKKEIDVKGEIQLAFAFISVVFATLVLGGIFAIATWGWLLLSLESPSLLVLSGWACLFYAFSIVAFPVWKNLEKYYGKTESNKR